MKSQMDLDLNSIALDLFEAANTVTTIAPITDAHPELSLADAYAVQSRVISMRFDKGERLIGRKVGLTSEAMRKLLDVDEPDFGCLTDAMQTANGGRIERSSLIKPKVEAEIAFVIGSDIASRDVSMSDLRRSIKGAVASLEIIDSRIADWRIKLADTVADNGSSALFVIGDQIVPLADLDLPTIEMKLDKNGMTVQRGFGRAVLGDPLEALSWLVKTLAEFGEELKADDIVLPGSLAAAVDADAGDSFSAEFDHLGIVAVDFV